MKDKLMEIQFEHGTIRVWHKSLIGRLNDVFDIGNHYRMLEGKEPRALRDWIRNKDTIEMLGEFNYRMDNFDYITGEPIIPRKQGNLEVADYKEKSLIWGNHHNMEVVDPKEITKKALTTKRGKNGGTYAHLHIMIQAAQWFSKSFEFDVTRKFIVDNIYLT